MDQRFDQPSARIAAIREELLAAPRSVCLERPRLLRRWARSEQGRASRGEHALVRRARALAYLMSRRRPRLFDGELIAGNMTSHRVAGNYYPEGGTVNLLEDLGRLQQRTVPLHMSGREQAEMVALGLWGLPYCVGARALLRPGRIGHFFDFFRARRYFVTEEAGVSHQVVDYGMVVHRGLHHPEAEARRALDEGRTPAGAALDDDARAFYESVVITVGGVRAMAANLAAAARDAAAVLPPSSPRRAELEAMAERCQRVPYDPARTFAEGLQACWLVHLALNLEDFEQGLSFGRLDRILGPLYDADIAAGRLDPAGAAELLASFCLKTCETMPLYSERIDEYFSGLGVAQGITLGGTDARGRDVTNDVSALVLDAYAQVRTREPALHVRVHAGTPEWFLRRCASVVCLGAGKPSFFGDPAIVRALTRSGMHASHARDYAVIGCVELASQGRTYNSSDAALFNLGLCLELALNGGRPLSQRRTARQHPRSGRDRLAARLGNPPGAPTRPPEAMRSLDDVVDAFRLQVIDAVDEMSRVLGYLELAARTWRPTPVNSMLTDGCLATGRDVTWGGARYDRTSIQGVGLASVADALGAIDRLVFIERRMTLPQLVDILAADWQGHEALAAEMRHKLPRYGNDDAAADRYATMVSGVFSDVITARHNTRGGSYIAGFYTMTCHHAFGRRTGALPDGRRAGERLSNGLAPIDGADRHGPTALLNSAARLDSSALANGYALNVKFDPAAVAGERGEQLLSSLVRGFVDSGGMQVQINVVDAATLRAAQADPAAHPGLVVRVAGYCAYFADLRPEVQDEIIARTAHG